jgi:hypothetical protein
MLRGHKSFVPRAPTHDELAEEASRRMVADDGLLPWGCLIEEPRTIPLFKAFPIENGKLTTL